MCNTLWQSPQTVIVAYLKVLHHHPAHAVKLKNERVDLLTEANRIIRADH
jgi:hypothetical protein